MVKNSRQHFELIWYTAWFEIKAQVSRVYLGFAWWVIEPVMYMATFYLVFGVIFERGGPGFPAFLLTGLVAYRWFDSGVRSASESILRGSNLIKQTYIPKYVLPFSTVVAASFKSLIIVALLIVFLLTLGYTPTATWTAIAPILATIFVLTLFVGGITAILVPFLPDLRILISNGLTLLLFLSGIFYSTDQVPESLRTYFFMNPLAIVIQAMRDVLLSGAWPHWNQLGWVFAISSGGLVLLMAAFKKLDKVYPKRVL